MISDDEFEDDGDGWTPEMEKLLQDILAMEEIEFAELPPFDEDDYEDDYENDDEELT